MNMLAAIRWMYTGKREFRWICQKLCAHVRRKSDFAANCIMIQVLDCRKRTVLRRRWNWDRGRFQVTFDLQKVGNICGIRWNLLSDTFCEVKVEVLDCGCHGELIPFGMRIDKAADAVVFLNLAGGYFIHVTDPSELKKITISGQIRFLSQKEIAEEIQLEEDRKEAVRREEERKLQQRIQKEERIAAKKAEEERRQEEASGSHGISASNRNREQNVMVKKMLGRPCGPTGYRKSTDRTAGIELCGKYRQLQL